MTGEMLQGRGQWGRVSCNPTNHHYDHHLRRRWIHQKLDDRHLSTKILHQLLHDARTQTRTRAAANCTKYEESPQAAAAFRHTAYGIHGTIKQLTGHKVVATSEIAAAIIFARDQGVRVE